MNRKAIVIVCLMLLSLAVKGQESKFAVPDYDKIKSDIQDRSSNFYYPKLMERLKATDTLLTHEEYRHLYFGYVFDKDYNSFWTSPDQDALLKFYRSETIASADYDKIIKLSNHSIASFPFDLRTMNFLAYVYDLKGDKVMAKKTSAKFQGLLKAIFSSGDGISCDTGFHVLIVSHEYVLMNMLELTTTGQSLIGHCDYLALEKGKYKIEGIYFDITKMLENERNALGGK